ncbi:MAG TPA: tail fiber domain-containing protein [Myxococcota bacterium]|nr:tail fiber domain-containing protein [Myxococcota bacterium]
MWDRILKSTFSCVAWLVVATPALAGDVSLKLDAGSGFSIQDNTGTSEHFRVDEATGNVSRHGALFVHTTGSSGSVFMGQHAGNASTSGASNSAFGAYALHYNTTGNANSAVGVAALYSNTTGYGNSAIGQRALFANTTGNWNSAVGSNALASSTSGGSNSAFGAGALGHNTLGRYNTAAGINALSFNTIASSNSAFGQNTLTNNYAPSACCNSAFGSGALQSNVSGSSNSAFGLGALGSNSSGARNVAVGQSAGANQTTGSDNLYLANSGVAAESGQIKIGTAGTHTRAFIAGIRGVTTVNANAIPVLIDSAGQLGTASSSRTVKKDIRDMGDTTARLLELRPVTFRYREQQPTLPDGSDAPPEYGLVAEEVAEVFPDLVVYDDEGKPFTVKYHELAPMLLNEMKRQQREHAQEMATLTARLAQLEEKVARAPEAAR